MARTKLNDQEIAAELAKLRAGASSVAICTAFSSFAISRRLSLS